jgi:hypothetical protein
MTETYPITQSHSKNEKFQKVSALKKLENNTKHTTALSSSSLDSSFDNINSEIKSIIENEHDVSFSSDSNSELAETRANMEHLFNYKYWRCNNNKVPEIKEKNKKTQFPTPIKCGVNQTYAGTSEGSNKQSTQSNEDEENRTAQNVSSFESNNNSSSHSEEKEKNIQILKKEKENSSNKINNNNIQNLKFNNKMNEQEYIYPYETMNYKNNNFQFFPGLYLSPQIYPFMPSYNYPSLNKKNYITNNNNNINNRLDGNNSQEKNDQIKLNTTLKTQNQYINPYMNNINNINNFNKKINQNQMDLKDLPLVMNNVQNNQNTNMNYPCQKLNFNMICCPQIQPINSQVQNHILDKTNNSSNILPEINHKDATKITIQEKKLKNNNSNNNQTHNNNVCPIIGKGNNNEIKINNKSFINNKSTNNNTKGNIKGEKQFLNLDDIVTGKDTRTTVMIRNIPIKYTDQILTNALSEFSGKYDCLYMPYDYEKNGNKGYAFINFVNPLHILYFYEKFNGKKWVHFESAKICELNCAHFQGINEIQKHAKNYKGQKKPNYYSINENENMIIPLKYLPKLLKRFPKMKYSENKGQNIITVKSFE